MESLLRRRGNAEWDAVLRGTGIVALLALYPSARWPWVAGLAGFLCLTLFVSGPISVVVPAAFEPMLMVAGRLYPPLLVAVVAVTGNLYMDYINYHVFGAAIRHPRLEQARTSRLVRNMLALFQRSPFVAVWLCSWSPIPYWIVSTLAPLSRYPMRRYLFATLLGRFPRVWFFASLGFVVPVSTQVLVTYVACAIVVGLIAVAWRRRATALRDHSLAPQPLVEPASTRLQTNRDTTCGSSRSSCSLIRRLASASPWPARSRCESA